VIFMKENLFEVKDVELVHIILNKYINILVNGNKIVLMVKENFIKINRFFFKAFFRKV
jgi:hypothetical protein